MRLHGKYVLVALAGLLLAGAALSQQTTSQPVQTQPQTSFPGGFGTPLFQNPNVSQALNLTPQQLAQLNEANRRLQAQFQRESGNVGRFSDPERNRRRQELMQAYNAELMQSAGTIMNPQQLSRYQQLELQNRGFDAFADVEVRRRLSLAEAQLQALQDLNQRSNQELQAILQSGRNQEEALRRYDAWRWQTWNQRNAILNEIQRQTWSQMIGQPFNFPPPNFNNNPGR